MGIITAIVAVVAAVGSYIVSEKGRQEAKALNKQAASEQAKARSEEKASSAQKAALERRQQIREERVANGRLMQASENSGTMGSSGQLGAQSGLASQLGATIGFNLGQIQSANNISQYNQSAANFQGAAQQALSDAAGKAGLFNLVGSVAGAASSYGSAAKSAGGGASNVKPGG